MTHPYFTAKAREVFTEAGGDPDRASALAAWAEALRTGPDYDSHVTASKVCAGSSRDAE